MISQICKRVDIKQSIWLVFVMPFAFGTGLPILVGIAFMGAILDWRRARNIFHRFVDFDVKEYIFLSLLCIFLICYVSLNAAEYIPSDTVLSRNKLSDFYFIKVVGASIYMGLVPIAIGNTSISLCLIGALALGAFARGFVSVLLSIHLEYPLPLYSSVFDIVTWSPGNSPAIANMLALSAVFCAACLGNCRSLMLGKLFIKILIIFIIFAVLCGSLLASRTFFFVVLVVSPILFIYNALADRGKKINWPYFFVVVFAVVAVAYVLKNSVFYGRPIGLELLNDGRFVLYKIFAMQIIRNPLAYAVVPESFGYPQFHNFFADVQRVSGTFSLISAVILVGYICSSLIKLLLKGFYLGRFFISIAIPCLLIMNASVEPEGGGQNYLMFIALGAFAAVALTDSRRKRYEPSL